MSTTVKFRILWKSFCDFPVLAEKRLICFLEICIRNRAVLFVIPIACVFVKGLAFHKVVILKKWKSNSAVFYLRRRAAISATELFCLVGIFVQPVLPNVLTAHWRYIVMK